MVVIEFLHRATRASRRRRRSSSAQSASCRRVCGRRRTWSCRSPRPRRPPRLSAPVRRTALGAAPFFLAAWAITSELARSHPPSPAPRTQRPPSLHSTSLSLSSESSLSLTRCGATRLFGPRAPGYRRQLPVPRAVTRLPELDCRDPSLPYGFDDGARPPLVDAQAAANFCISAAEGLPSMSRTR